jgi:hypothetical protein
MKLFRYGGEATRLLRLPEGIDVYAIGWLMRNRYIHLNQLDITLRSFETEVDFRIFPRSLHELTIRVETESAKPASWAPTNVGYLEDVHRLTFEDAYLCRGDFCRAIDKLKRLESLQLLRCYFCKRLQTLERIEFYLVDCVTVI